MTPEISLCVWRHECPLAGICYRVLAEPDEWNQSYFAPSKLGKDCPYFIEATPKDEEKKA
jgi:hypothetical protein